jgi:hypothetical protein
MKYTNIFHCKTVQNLSIFGFLVSKYIYHLAALFDREHFFRKETMSRLPRAIFLQKIWDWFFLHKFLLQASTAFIIDCICLFFIVYVKQHRPHSLILKGYIQDKLFLCRTYNTFRRRSTSSLVVRHLQTDIGSILFCVGSSRTKHKGAFTQNTNFMSRKNDRIVSM